MTESLWFDEIWYTFQFLNSSSCKRVLFLDVHPPFYSLILLGWIHIFGDSELSVRLPSFIFGIVSIAIIYLVAKEWFDQKTAVLSAALMSLSPVHIWFSQENKNNMLLMLLTLLSVYALQLAWKYNSNFLWIGFVTASVLSLYTNLFALWVVISSFLWIWFKVFFGNNKIYFKKVIISSLVVILLFLPLIIKTFLQLDFLTRGYLRAFTPQELYKLFLIYLSHGNTIRTFSPYASLDRIFEQPWRYFVVDIFFALLVIYGLIILLIRLFGKDSKNKKELPDDKRSTSLLLIYFMMPPLLLMVASLFYKHIYIERSMIIMLPPFLIVLAHGVLSIPYKRLVLIGIGLLLVLNTFALYNLWIAKSDTWTVYKQKPDWKAATVYLKSQITQNYGHFAIFLTTPFGSDPMKYYYNRIIAELKDAEKQNCPQTIPIHDLNPLEKSRFDAFLVDNAFDIFYIVHNNWSQNFKSIFEIIQPEKTYMLLEKATFKGVEIYKFRKLRDE